ncbi:O-methylsterigmatocystin oxidoreductase [Termitomyces sp. J132]|nr:O-methylsterigmatocystin oxidoreductase [Termitomyces sp. J132]
MSLLHRSEAPHLCFPSLGMSDALLFTKYGKDFRLQRRMIQQHFTNAKRSHHHPVQTREARVLAQNLLRMPGNWEKCLLRFSTSIISQVSYGHQIVSEDDQYFKISQECCQKANELGPLGITPIDILPLLRFCPSWFPGTYFSNVARNSFHTFQRLREYPYNQMVEMISKGTAQASFLYSLLENLDTKGPEAAATINQIQATSAIIHVGGTDTTSGMLAFFILAMVLYPECQMRAQKEIETIIGPNRLPEFYDRSNLRYLECVVQEVMRYANSGQSNIFAPHKVMEDDIYRGMLIPKGSIIIANIRAMTLNEAIYQDPFTFDPTRYLPAPAGKGEPYSTSNFGFGRRICPGRFLSDDNLWMSIATMLATVNFSKALDEDGKDIIPDATTVYSGVTKLVFYFIHIPGVTIILNSHPKSFKCCIKARNPAAQEVLQQSLKN